MWTFFSQDLKHHGTDEMSLPIPPCDELITPAKMKTLLDKSKRRKRRKVKDLTSSLDAMKWDISSPIKHALDTSYPSETLFILTLIGSPANT